MAGRRVAPQESWSSAAPSGTGKTFLLEALGHAAVEAGRHMAWFTVESLGVLVRRHRADDSLTNAITRILGADLVIVDDIGLLPVRTYRLLHYAHLCQTTGDSVRLSQALARKGVEPPE